MQRQDVYGTDVKLFSPLIYLIKRKILSLSEVGKLFLKPPKQWKISTRLV
jgi:hypothetical protein